MSPPRAGSVRRPRAFVTVNGIGLIGVIEAEVTNNSHFTADTFRVTAAVSGLPPQLGPDYWSDSEGDEVAVYAAFEDEAPTRFIVGQVDEVDYDPARRTLTLTGRDFSARLIDARTTEKFQNLTASAIAERLAARHGLTPGVQATGAKAGTYYELDHVTLTQEQSEWDLLIYLAEQEGFDCWVSGTTLYFQPPPVETAPPYLLRWEESGEGPPDANFLDIRLQRSQTLARDVIVKVRSWNQKQQRSFTVTYKVTQAKKGQRAGGIAQTYGYSVPNLTHDQALQYAQKMAEQITRHERVLMASLPGDTTLNTRAMVQLAGTGTEWDQRYYPDTITRRLSQQEGFRMELRAKNHSTQSTVTL